MKRCVVLLLFCIAALIFTTSAAGAFAETKFETSAQSAVVMEKTSHRILFSKNCDMHLPMASTTKIVTALTVINNSNLDDVVCIPTEACGIEGSSIYLRAGEHLSVRELLYGLMLRSGNDCAVALALHTGGSVADFAKMMNRTASDLGCKDSNFVNPHGLHDDMHYTTAKDLATITCEALNNEEFGKIVSAKSFRISNEGYDYDRVLVNKNKLLTGFDGADGVKTGYTKKAGRCFVGSATRNGMQVVVAVLNCGPMFEETASMLNTAFSAYKLKTVIPQNKVCGMTESSGKRRFYICENAFTYPITSDERLTTSIDLLGNAKITVFLNGEFLKEFDLKSV